MIGIYLFKNKLNNKCYVGQSQNILKRYREHTKKSSNSLIDLAILKYGIENFEFSVLEECSINELNEKEIYYISKYNCLNPLGYNLQLGGKATHYEGYYKFTKEEILDIYEMLKNIEYSLVDIAKIYNVSPTLIGYINRGEEYTLDNINYPIRKEGVGKEIQKSKVAEKIQGEQSYRATITQENVENLIKDLCNTTTSMTDLAKKYKVGYDVVKDINRGKSWKFIERPIPCRGKKFNTKLNWDIVHSLKDLLINTTLSYSEISKKYEGCSPRILTRINNGENWYEDTYNYPLRKKS